MSYSSDLTGEQWDLLQPVFNAPGKPTFRPIRHAWRVEVAHGRLGRSRRLAKSFENTTTSATGWLQVACIATTLRHLSRERTRRPLVELAARPSAVTNRADRGMSGRRERRMRGPRVGRPCP